MLPLSSMEIFVHALLFIVSGSVLWFFAGLLIEATEAVAKRLNKSSFTVAFFVLGFLTSIGELSVMTNSFIEGVPDVSVGNLIGSSFITLLFIVPMLAIIGRGVHLKNTLNNKHLILTLAVAILPVLMVLDGEVHMTEGLVCLMAYVTLFYFIEGSKWWGRKSNSVPEIIDEIGEELVDTKYATWKDIGKIVVGAAAIFISGNILVEESIYFSELLMIPGSLIGLLLLSIGTNTPELAIAVRAIRHGNVDIAFGDYLGSTVAVTVIFSILSLLSGTFSVDPTAFYFTAGLMVTGFIAFYVFSRSKEEISHKEGIILILFYVAFLLSQATNLLLFV